VDKNGSVDITYSQTGSSPPGSAASDLQSLASAAEATAGSVNALMADPLQLGPSMTVADLVGSQPGAMPLGTSAWGAQLAPMDGNIAPSLASPGDASSAAYFADLAALSNPQPMSLTLPHS
jgi:hypothetical protein